MPIVYTEVDVSGSSYLGDPNIQSNVVKQTNYTGLWFKKNGSGVWEGYSTQPSGTVVDKNFAALVPSPSGTQVYQPSFGEENVIMYHGTSNPVNTYYHAATSKWKCGLPV